MILETLGVFAGGYALLVGGLAVFQRDMIYHPGRERPTPAESGVPEMAEVPVRTQDGILVTGWYAPPPTDHAPLVVYFHGNAGTLARRAPKARVLIDAGYGVLLAGYRGFGGNPGRPSEPGLYADARAALGWLQRIEGIGRDRMAIYGESLGTGVATQMAHEFEGIGALILEAPFTSLVEMAPPIFLPGMADMLMVDRYESLGRIGNNQSPLLILHGEQDGLVPVDMGRRMLDAAQGDKEGVFLPKAGHNDIWENGGQERLLDFLERVLPAGPRPSAISETAIDQ